MLMRELERLQSQLTTMQTSWDAMIASSDTSNADDEHDPEGATIAFERSQLSAQMAHVKAGLDGLERALNRWVDGTYGRCEMCGLPIAPARLEARPAAATCITCAR